MNYVGMCFENSNRIYTFKTEQNLEKDKSYWVILSDGSTYGCGLRYFGEVEEPPKAAGFQIKEITEVVEVD